ncbi:MAG: deoxyribonuclease V [Methylococcaceae bacterium]|nr:deoxyribonuclease V [Methylococcaceae bacterium]
MKLEHLHPWNLTPKEAIAVQRELRNHLILHDDFGEVRRVAGVDCGFEQGGSVIRAAVAVLSFPGLEPVEQAVAHLATAFPYVPGLLSFREIPAVLAALEKLAVLPDLLLVDGQGLAHPRRLGIACHLGLLTNLPALGVGKTRLIGSHEEPPQCRGGWVPLMDGQERIGAVLRSRAGVKPLFISAGHRINLESSVDWVMRCTTHYRLPETTRHAHRLASG